MATRPAPGRALSDLEIDWADVAPEPARTPRAAPKPKPRPAATARQPAASVASAVSGTTDPTLVAADRPRGLSTLAIRRGKAASAALLVGALFAAVVSGAQNGDAPVRTAASAAVAAAPADCVTAWNAPGNTAARGALPAGAIVRVARVDPLPGTLLRGRPCAVSYAVPGSDRRGAWADGVEGQAGFVDLSGYPAARRYAAPRDAAAANATLRADGTLAAR